LHFVLHVDKIAIKKSWRDKLIAGKGIPSLPVDFGFRNNADFWFTKMRRPYKVPIPREKSVTVGAVRYAVERVDPDIEWLDEACAKLVKIPRVFMTRVIRECVEAAKEEGVTEITPEFLDKVRDKRRQEKGG
jgi:hypothetical protein